jgi:3-deoxy-D-manno-octulosonic-acid transferase
MKAFSTLRMRLGGWALNAIYAGLAMAAAPLLLFRCTTQGKYRTGWSQKLLGRAPARDGRNRCVWFHAVSVGEVLLLRQVVARLKSQSPTLEIWISTTTSTGHAVACEKFPDAQVIYFPLDFTWSVRQAIRRVRPDLVALVELELWPNFIAAVHEAGVPLVLLNGRMSERSFRGYRRISGIVGRWLRKFTMLTAQTEQDASRLIALGGRPEQLVVTGSVKYDGLEFDRDNPATRELREAFGILPGEMVFIAGSTQAPEEEIALEAYERLKNDFPNLRLMLVPRHRERFEDVAALVLRRGHALRRRSRPLETAQDKPGCGRGRGEGVEDGARPDDVPLIRPVGHLLPASKLESQDAPLAGRRLEVGRCGRLNDHSPANPPSDACPVLLLDTLGELSAAWGLADVAFVGGSLTRRGGQNMLEPAAYGAAVLFGPNTFNFRHAVELLLSRQGAKVVHSADDLEATVRTLLSDSGRRNDMGRAARQALLSQQGATEKSVALIETLLETGAKTMSAAA